MTNDAKLKCVLATIKLNSFYLFHYLNMFIRRLAENLIQRLLLRYNFCRLSLRNSYQISTLPNKAGNCRLPYHAESAATHTNNMGSLLFASLLRSVGYTGGSTKKTGNLSSALKKLTPNGNKYSSTAYPYDTMNFHRLVGIFFPNSQQPYAMAL